ncbi:MAG: hypothetical protein Q7T61_18910 [Caulobacter sp.]|nr:hypothetical protein [Caulobacter sp.]
MSPDKQDLAVNYLSQIRDAAVEARHAIAKAVSDMTAPAVLHRARLFADGRRWCAQIGQDPALAGYGLTPDDACEDLADVFFGRPRAPIPPA